MLIQRLHKKLLITILFILTTLSLQGCSDNYADETRNHRIAVKSQLADLKSNLDTGRIRNAVIVKLYAAKLKELDPSMASIANALALDASSRGSPYQSLLSRFAKVAVDPDSKETYAPIKKELDSIYAGSDSVIFNDSQLDLVNTLADLSQGALPRINIPKQQSNQDVVAGSQLVGNPQYGQFRNDSNGNSFWSWYGKYAMFSSVMGFSRGPIYYNSWFSRPRYSYYNDYGRSTYGTSRSRANWTTNSNNLKSKGGTVAKPRKSYASAAGQRKASTYQRGATYKTANKQYGAKSNSSSYSSTKKTYSSGRRKSNYSFFGSSSRGTGYGSRSSRGGK